MKDYFFATGERKTSVAKVRIFDGTGKILVNGKDFRNYFPYEFAEQFTTAPFKITKLSGKFDVSAIVSGGGLISQAEAVRHAITRALIKFDSGLKHLLRQGGFVTRDPRMKERKKPGLKRARRAPQWRKR
ncbi:MAG: 30S ribosomal protein S9 [Patescibacteria group bacterium]